MKTFLKFFLLFVLASLSLSSFAQAKTEKIKVAGECGTCKKKIEKSAKAAGASYALWNPDSKLLTVKYNAASTSSDKIQHAIAATGYDTPKYKGDDEAYSKLDECCQYERSASAHSCCADAKCEKSACMKDGKCARDMPCCKDAGCDKKDCCKKA